MNIMTTSNLFTLPYAPGGWAGDAPSARDYGLPDARDLQGLPDDASARPRATEAAYAPRVPPLGPGEQGGYRASRIRAVTFQRKNGAAGWVGQIGRTHPR